MKQIKIGSLPIDIHEGPIGIMLSGGADSSILLYILMKYAEGPIHAFSCGNGRTNHQEPLGALKVINRVIEMTGRRDIFFRAHWVERKVLDTLFDRTLVRQANVNVVYGAFTRPPPDDAITDFDTDADYVPKGLSEKVNDHYYENNKLYYPFSNINKKGIYQLYKDLDVEDLYSYTRSCESLTLTSGHCGKCWWCKERIWAFGKLE